MRGRMAENFSKRNPRVYMPFMPSGTSASRGIPVETGWAGRRSPHPKSSSSVSTVGAASTTGSLLKAGSTGVGCGKGAGVSATGSGAGRFLRARNVLSENPPVNKSAPHMAENMPPKRTYAPKDKTGTKMLSSVRRVPATHVPAESLSALSPVSATVSAVWSLEAFTASFVNCHEA